MKKILLLSALLLSFGCSSSDDDNSGAIHTINYTGSELTLDRSSSKETTDYYAVGEDGTGGGSLYVYIKGLKLINKTNKDVRYGIHYRFEFLDSQIKGYVGDASTFGTVNANSTITINEDLIVNSVKYADSGKPYKVYIDLIPPK